MSESLSPVKRKLPEVRMACFCDQVIQGADNAISIIRIIDRVTVEVARPPTPADTTNESIPYPVTLFAMLDGGASVGREFRRILGEVPSRIIRAKGGNPARFG